MKILVTGGTGFIGQHVVRTIAAHAEDSVVAGLRAPRTSNGAGTLVLGDLDGPGISLSELADFDAIVHTAGMSALSNPTELARLRAVNVQGTISLARAAAEAGVKRFVFLSSAKVGGETTPQARPLTEQSPPAPLHPYGQSKLDAERGLEAIAEKSSMAVTILRPPLVYGPGVGGNFRMLAQAVRRGIPLPLGKASNLRSLIGVRNLVDVIRTSIRHPDAANRVYYVADRPDLSTSELLRRLGDVVGRPARLISIDPAMISKLSSLVGKRGIYDRLFASFQVDTSQVAREIGWVPPFSGDQERANWADD